MRVWLVAVVIALSMMTSGSARAQTSPDPDPDPWFGTDKALHFGAGFGIAAAGYAGGIAAFDDRWSAVAFGSGISIGLGAAKEGLDAAGLGQPSWKDFAWDVIGAALGIGVAVSFDAALRGPDP